MFEREANELKLYIDNQEYFYKKKIAVFKALAKKKDAGKYIHDKAAKAFGTLLVEAAKDYVRHYGSIHDKWSQVYSVIARKHAADALAEDFLDWYREDWPSLKGSKK